MELKDYLKRNYSIIDNSKEDSMEELSIMDNNLKGKKVFLTGENHGVKANIELRMKFLKYFKEKTNFKYYLWELPYSSTYFLNRYLETGDESILKDVYKPLEGTYGWNKDEYNHWKDLYKYNQSLPPEERIIPIGIDIEHQPSNAFKFIEDCLDKNNILETIIEDIRKLRSKVEIKNEELVNLSNKIARRLKENEALYKRKLKEDYFALKLINDNLLNMVEVYASNNFNGYRDKRIYENFIRLYNNLPENKYFGQLGLSHVFQRRSIYVPWFASSLNDSESQFKNKILSIVYAYNDCRYLYPTPRRNYTSSINTLDYSIKELESFATGRYTLFKLNEGNSPFSEKLIWPFKHKLPEGGVTTDYFQYLVVIKNSEEMEALGK